MMKEAGHGDRGGRVRKRRGEGTEHVVAAVGDFLGEFRSLFRCMALGGIIAESLRVCIS